MIGRPSKLETAVDDRDPESRGWNVIDHGAWERLSGLLKLPASSRPELVAAVWQERVNHRARANHPPPAPNQSRKELGRLRRIASNLLEGLRKSDDGVRSALLLSLRESTISGPVFPSQLEFFDSKPIEALDSDVERICNWLARAVEIAGPWHGRRGNDSALRNFVEYLDMFVLCHTGKGLVRTRMPKDKPKPSRGTNCCDFVVEVARLAFGENVKEKTVDDAMKEVIKRRRRKTVGTEES